MSCTLYQQSGRPPLCDSNSVYKSCFIRWMKHCAGTKDSCDKSREILCVHVHKSYTLSFMTAWLFDDLPWHYVGHHGFAKDKLKCDVIHLNWKLLLISNLHQAPGKRHDKLQLTVNASRTLHKCVRIKDKNGLKLIINVYLPCGKPSGRLNILPVDRAEQPWDQRLTHSNSKTESISPSHKHTHIHATRADTWAYTFILITKCVSWICTRSHIHTNVYQYTPARD